jgi:hypothetical protein
LDLVGAEPFPKRGHQRRNPVAHYHFDLLPADADIRQGRRDRCALCLDTVAARAELPEQHPARIGRFLIPAWLHGSAPSRKAFGDESGEGEAGGANGHQSQPGNDDGSCYLTSFRSHTDHLQT